MLIYLSVSDLSLKVGVQYLVLEVIGDIFGKGANFVRNSARPTSNRS